MEQNKRLFKWFAIVSAILMVGGIMLVILLMPDTFARRMQFVLFTFLPEVVCLIAVYASLRHPQINRQYTLRRIEGRWHFVRRVYGPDPEGLRYRTYGFVMLGLALIFLFTDVITIWPVPDVVTICVVLLIAIPTVILVLRCESKLSTEL